MMTPGQAFELEKLQERLAIGDGELLDFARQFSFDHEECGAGADLFSLDKLTRRETETLISQLRYIEEADLEERRAKKQVAALVNNSATFNRLFESAR